MCNVHEWFNIKRGADKQDKTVETHSMPAILRWVQEGLAGTIQTQSLAASLDRSSLCAVPISRGVPEVRLELIHRSDRYMGEAIKRLIEKIHAVLTERSGWR